MIFGKRLPMQTKRSGTAHDEEAVSFNPPRATLKLRREPSAPGLGGLSVVLLILVVPPLLGVYYLPDNGYRFSKIGLERELGYVMLTVLGIGLATLFLRFRYPQRSHTTAGSETSDETGSGFWAEFLYRLPEIIDGWRHWHDPDRKQRP